MVFGVRDLINNNVRTAVDRASLDAFNWRSDPCYQDDYVCGVVAVPEIYINIKDEGSDK